MIGALGSFGSLMLSFTRLPAVMAADGFLPRAFTRHHPKTGAPWVAIVGCAVAWAACLPLGFFRLLILDVLLTGSSILLEFGALIALRIREPNLPRPYRIPGGILATIAITVPPSALLGRAGYAVRPSKALSRVSRVGPSLEMAAKPSYGFRR